MKLLALIRETNISIHKESKICASIKRGMTNGNAFLLKEKKVICSKVRLVI